MAKKKMISEILELAAKCESQEERSKFLKENYSIPLITILRGAFDDSVQWNLPKGEPPYRKDDAPKGYEPSNLYKQQRRFGYFVKGGKGESMSAVKREQLFISILESLHPNEAELVIAMKDKKLAGKYKGVTEKLIRTTWPNLIQAKETVKKSEKKVAVKEKTED